MPIVVQKYGGTSVDGVDRLRVVADRVVEARDAGNDVIVVVSAMGQTTDDLARMAKDIAPEPDPRDGHAPHGGRTDRDGAPWHRDQRSGMPRRQLHRLSGRIITDTAHGQARIIEIRPKRILEALDAGNVVIIAGFQGLSSAYEITTLGRGGSDPHRRGHGGGRGAEVCEIYTDVGGVMTADPRIVPEARLIERIGYDDMLELAAAGRRCSSRAPSELARRSWPPAARRSSFDDEAPGTWVQEVDDDMEDVPISGVALETDEAKVTFDGIPDTPGVAAALFKAVASAGVSVDMIVQNVSHEGVTDLSFTAPIADVSSLESTIGGIAQQVDARNWSVDDGVAEDLARRSRDEESAGRRGGHVRRARARRDQHRDDLHLTDPHLVRGAEGGRGARPRVVHTRFGLDGAAVG